MQIKETAKEALKREYNVTVSAADIAAETEAKLKEVGKTVKISGFRPGHVPMNLLRQRYGKSVMGDVLEKAVQDASDKVISEKKLRPALRPEIKITVFEDGKDLEFSMAVELFPEVPELDLGGVEIEKPVFELDNSQVEEALSRLAEQNKKRSPKADSAKAAKGDVVRIDFKGLKGGEAFAGGTAQNFNLELGSGQFIPGFEDQLIGAKKGDEVKVDVTFPKEYQAKDLAGQPVVFEVTVHEVLANDVPKVDDAFAKEIGFEDLKALKASIKEHLEKDYGQYVRNRMKKDLFDRLEDLCVFDVPQGMVEAEFKQIWAKLKQAQAQGDESVAGREDEELEEEYHAIAERRVRLGIYLAELGRVNNVQVSQQELMGAVVQQARMYPGQEAQVVEFYRKHPQHIDELRGPLFEDKVVDLIFGRVKTKDKKVTVEELVQMDFEEGEKPAKKKAASKPKAKKEEGQPEPKKAAKSAEAKEADAKKAEPKKTAGKAKK